MISSNYPRATSNLGVSITTPPKENEVDLKKVLKLTFQIINNLLIGSKRVATTRKVVLSSKDGYDEVLKNNSGLQSTPNFTVSNQHQNQRAPQGWVDVPSRQNLSGIVPSADEQGFRSIWGLASLKGASVGVAAY